MCNETSNTSGPQSPQPKLEAGSPLPESVPSPAVGMPGETTAGPAGEKNPPREIAAVGWGTPGENLRGLALGAGRKGRRLVRKDADKPATTAEQRLLILDTWRRSGLPGADFGAIVGISKHTLYTWKKRFDEHGPAGLMEARRGTGKGSRLPELTVS